MKRILSILPVIMAFFQVSCSNEEIPVQHATVVRVNPATVVSNFTYQVNAGDLDGVDDSERVRIRLYLFDESGKLFTQQEQTVGNYLTTATFEVGLTADVAFTAVAVVDVTNELTGKVAEYWGISNEQNLNSMEVSYLGSEFNYGSQEILGLSSAEVRSGDNLTIDVESAGMLICTWAQNLHAYDDVAYLLVWGSRGNGHVSFSDSGSPVMNPDLNVNPSFLNLETAESGYGTYSYKFLMPQTNYTITTVLLDGDQSILSSLETEGQTLEQGHEYLYHIVLDPDDDASGNWTVTLSDVTGVTQSSLKPELESLPLQSGQSVSDGLDDEARSYRVADLLKR